MMLVILWVIWFIIGYYFGFYTAKVKFMRRFKKILDIKYTAPTFKSEVKIIMNEVMNG